MDIEEQKYPIGRYQAEEKIDKNAIDNFIEEIKFVIAYSFIYSQRPGTPAQRKDNIPLAEKKDRRIEQGKTYQYDKTCRDVSEVENDERPYVVRLKVVSRTDFLFNDQGVWAIAWYRVASKLYQKNFNIKFSFAN